MLFNLAEAVHISDSYFLLLDSFIKNNKIPIILKFDTGAAQTIISLGAFSKGLSTQNINSILTQIKQVNSFSFRDASGNILKAYPCYLKNITINKIFLDIFYFWLNPNLNLKKALLGNDFIKYCNFNHNINGDIIIKDFDKKNYLKSHMKKRKFIQEIEISEFVEEKVLNKIYCILLKDSKNNIFNYEIVARTPKDALIKFIKSKTSSKFFIQSLDKLSNQKFQYFAIVKLKERKRVFENYYGINFVEFK